MLPTALNNALAGLANKFPGQPDKLARTLDSYAYRLRTRRTPADVRGTLAELLADGAVFGGQPVIEGGADAVVALLREIEADPERARTTALLLLAAAPEAGQ